MTADSLVIILAGGVGERLYPLTKERAKPAVYFGGPYRIIDFTLSNCINSGFRRIFIATQYKSLSLNRHIRMGWNVFAEELGEFIEILPPQKRVGEHWYLGTADAVYQNLYSITRENPKHVIVLSGDHVYKMDYAKMLRAHRERGAAATIACLEVPLEEGSRFGIVQIDGTERVTGFQEKPRQPRRFPGSPDVALGSMGVYIFEADELYRALEADAARQTNHDFGKDILPAMIKDAPVFAYRFHDENKKAAKYWRDIGTLDAYYEANMDLVPRQSRVQSLRSRMGDAHPSAAGAAREVRVRRRATTLRHGDRLDHLVRAASSREPRQRLRALSERPRAQLLRRSKTRS